MKDKKPDEYKVKLPYDNPLLMFELPLHMMNKLTLVGGCGPYDTEIDK